MAAFGDLAGELVGRFPGLSPFLAQTFINRSYQKIRGEREWSFLETDGAVVCPPAIVTGTAAIVQGSPTVTMSAAARLQLIAAALPAGVTLPQLQIRFMGNATTSQIYNILSFVDTPPLVLTLDRPVQEATNALSPFMVYRVYLTPPIADFKRWISLVDMVNGFTIGRSRMTYSSDYFDLRDPQRQSLSLAYYLGFYKGSSALSSVDSTPIYELWPGATQGQRFYVRIQRHGADPVMTDPVPSALDTGVIIEGAICAHVVPHCMANMGHFPAMRGADWTTLVQVSKREYKERLIRAKITDDDVAMKSVWNRGHGLKGNTVGGVGFPYPIDSNFFQSHPIFW